MPWAQGHRPISSARVAVVEGCSLCSVPSPAGVDSPFLWIFARFDSPQRKNVFKQGKEEFMYRGRKRLTILG